MLVPFDISQEIIIQCDASQGGLGCGLIQDGKPISFASRSLTASERNYSQIVVNYFCVPKIQFLYLW